MQVVLRAAIAVALATSSAVAQVSAEAEQLFRDGRSAMATGRYVEACAAFDGSQRIAPKLTTLMNVASCREKNQQLASAWSAFLEAASQARAEGAGGLERTSREHAAQLESRVSKLEVTVPVEARLPGLSIKRGDVPLDAALWNRAVPTDGGTIVITASAPGRQSWSTQVSLGIERDSRAVILPVLPAEPASAEAEVIEVEKDRAGDGGRGNAVIDVTRLSPDLWRRRIAWAVTGIGSAALIASLGFELSARGALDDYRAAAPDSAREEQYDRANSRHHIAIGLAAVGVVSVGAAVYLFASNRRTTSRTVLAPVAVGDGWGLALVGLR